MSARMIDLLSAVDRIGLVNYGLEKTLNFDLLNILFGQLSRTDVCVDHLSMLGEYQF